MLLAISFVFLVITELSFCNIASDHTLPFFASLNKTVFVVSFERMIAVCLKLNRLRE